MRRKSKNYSGKKKNVQNKAKKSKTSAEDVSTPLIKDSLPVLPVKDSIELSAEGPSTSHDTSQRTIALLKPDELQMINEKVNFLLDKCFQNKPEIVVNLRLFEDIVSETLEHFYSQEDKCKDITEAKLLTEKCKALQTEQIKLNRQRYALKKQVEDAKHIIKKMVDEKHLFDRGVYRKIAPASMTRQVRSVGLQVCLVGPMFISKQVITYNPSILSQFSKSISPPPEQRRTARKRTLNKDISVRKNSESCKAKVTQSAKKNKAPPKKVNPSGNKLNVTTRRMSAESANSRAPTKKENPSRNNINVTNRRMSTRSTKIVEVEDTKPTPSVKVKSLKELNNGNKIVKQVEQIKNSDKGFGNAIHTFIKEEKFDDVVIKEEVIEEPVYDVIEISEDEEIEETIIETKDVLKVYDTKEAGIQVNVNNTNENVNNTNDNFCSKLNETSSQGAGPLIKVRSPEFINEHLIKSLNPSTSAPVSEHISFCQLPKYPNAPKYPPNVPKLPAPILQVGKKNNTETQGVMLTWSFACKKPENIVEYQLFAYQERSGRNSPSDWKKVGDIKALPLPMACFLSQFVEDETYYFIVRAVDSHKRLGDFSIPAGFKLQKPDPPLKTPAETIFKAPLPKNKF